MNFDLLTWKECCDIYMNIVCRNLRISLENYDHLVQRKGFFVETDKNQRKKFI
jgi:hypothetical protein